MLTRIVNMVVVKSRQLASSNKCHDIFLLAEPFCQDSFKMTPWVLERGISLDFGCYNGRGKKKTLSRRFLNLAAEGCGILTTTNICEGGMYLSLKMATIFKILLDLVNKTLNIPKSIEKGLLLA